MGLPAIAVPEYRLKLPSTGEELKYRPFLVKEEKILLVAMESESQEEIVNATKTIIENCIYGKIDVDKLATFDIEYIFLQLRGKAKGEIIELQFKCEKCQNPIETAINIDEIKVNKNEEHTNNIKLNDDIGVMMKYPTIQMQLDVEKMQDTITNVESLFETIMSCIDCIYDKENTYPSKDHTEKEMRDFIESLTDENFQRIAKFFETMPTLKHKIVLNCENKIKGKGKEKKTCNHKKEMTLEGLASFFD